MLDRKNQPRSWWQYLPADPIAPPALVVESAEPVQTGLVDQYGNPIMRSPRAIGYFSVK